MTANPSHIADFEIFYLLAIYNVNLSGRGLAVQVFMTMWKLSLSGSFKQNFDMDKLF